MCLVGKAAVLVVGAEARVYAVIVRGGVAVVCARAVAVGRVVLKHGGEPQRRNAKLLEVVEVAAYALQVASVAQAGLRAVCLVCVQALDVVVLRVAVGKTVGHEHVEHVGIGEAHTLLAALFARLQFVLNLLCRLAVLELESHLAGLCALEV